MSDRISGQKIAGVSAVAVVQQVGVATHWSAEQVKARKAVKAAFASHEKAQWHIGDLLNIIAPIERDDYHSPEATDLLKQVAEENGKAFSTIQRYRQVSSVYPEDVRDQFRTWQDADDALRDKAKGEAVVKDPLSFHDFIAKVHDAIQKAPVEDLSEEDATLLRLLILDATVIIDAIEARGGE